MREEDFTKTLCTSLPSKTQAFQILFTFIFFKKEKQIKFNRDGKQVDRFLGYVDNPMFTRKVSEVFAEAELGTKDKQDKGPESSKSKE